MNSRPPETDGADDRRQEGFASGGSGEPAALPEADDPVVLLDTELDDGKLFLVLANPGRRTAFEVKVDFAGPLMGLGGEHDLTEKRLFRGLPLLRPGREIRIFVDGARQLFARDQETAFQARVSWRSRHGDPFAQTFRHDLALWEDLGEVD